MDPSRGHVHVFDDVSLDFVLDTLDTVTDFVNYLTKRENLIIHGQLIGAAGEEDMLAYYLKGMNEKDEHDFLIPRGSTHLSITQGIWEHFEASPERKSQIDADKVSYNWDRMIERFGGHILSGTGITDASMKVMDRLCNALSQNTLNALQAESNRYRTSASSIG